MSHRLNDRSADAATALPHPTPIPATRRAARGLTSVAAALATALLLTGTPALRAAPPVTHEPALQRSQIAVTLPDVRLLRQDGRLLALREVLDDGRPVLLNFTYTSCSAICPVSAQVFAQVRERLGADRERVHLVSVSIDAAFDTVPRLREYVERLGSGSGWTFLTGHDADSVRVQQAFGAWRGDKMNHLPGSYLRAAPGQPWLRLDGLLGPDQLLAEVRALLVSRRPVAAISAPAVDPIRGAARPQSLPQSRPQSLPQPQSHPSKAQALDPLVVSTL